MFRKKFRYKKERLMGVWTPCYKTLGRIGIDKTIQIYIYQFN